MCGRRAGRLPPTTQAARFSTWGRLSICAIRAAMWASSSEGPDISLSHRPKASSSFAFRLNADWPASRSVFTFVAFLFCAFMMTSIVVGLQKSRRLAGFTRSALSRRAWQVRVIWPAPVPAW